MAQQRPPVTRRPAQPRAKRVSRIPDGYWKYVLAAVVMLAVAFVMQMIWPEGFKIDASGKISTEKTQVSVIYGTGPVRLNELMSSNPGVLVDENGVAGDWFEVANIGTEPVNLYGYSVAENARAANVFYFPDMVLQSGECAVVFANSEDIEISGSVLHAPFRLSSQGGSLMLFNRKGNAIDSINFPALAEGTTYARMDTTVWEDCDEPTPGLGNTGENYRLLQTPRTDAGVEIIELMASNTQYEPDENGTYHDYIRLRNTTNALIDLSGWYLSDDKTRPIKWRLPDGFTIEAGGTAVVYASGLDRADPDHPHTNFGLSTEGEDAVLSDATGRLVDSVSYDLLKRDQIYRKNEDGSWSVAAPEA